MKFPKAVMDVTELEAMGFDRKYLMRLTREPKQDFCWRQNPLKKTSRFLFDTENLARFIESQERLQSQSVRRGK